jgi:hypothetical protein
MLHLEKRRGKGRDDYPIRPTWNALIAGVVFQHESAASLLREMNRNAELRSLCGFDPCKGASAVPSDDAFGRFLEILMGAKEGILDIFHALIEELKSALPALGETLAVDSKGIRSFGNKVRDEAKRGLEDRRRDLDADKGVKKYRGKREDGTAWERVVAWFGYKLHLLVDSFYELPLAFRVTEASAGDSPELIPLVEDLKKEHPEILRRSRELAADKAYDSRENKRELYDGFGIHPLIDIRICWKDGEGTRSLIPGRADVFVYDEKGNVSCVCPATGEKRTLCFCGFEKDRKALKYRCPAAAQGFKCRGRLRCEFGSGVGEFGRTVRVPLETDRRIFTPVARHTRKWERAYDRRTAIERVNSRLDCLFGFEKHTIRGKRKMETRIALSLMVMLAMALGRIRTDQRSRMRSLLAPAHLRLTG